MDWFTAILIGTVQGILEWIPVSSERQVGIVSGHLGIQPEAAIALGLALHLGTALAVFARYPRQFVRVLDLRKTPGKTRFFWGVTIVSLACAFPFLWALEGLFEREWWLGTAVTLAAAIGIMLFGLAMDSRRRPVSRDLSGGGTADFLLVGAAQAFAALPGVTRLGLTFGTLLGRGFRRTEAFVFSLMLSLPVSLAAFAYAVVSGDLGTADIGVLAAAVLASFAAGYAAIAAMVGLAQASRFSRFCIFLGGLSIALILFFLAL